MQKHKKLFSILVAAFMVFAMMPMTALAADPNGLPEDSGLLGTLTVHKFAASAESNTTGSGMVITDTSNLGTKLGGVGFKLYKIDGAKLTALLADVEDKSFGTSGKEPKDYIQTGNIVDGYEYDDTDTLINTAKAEPKTNKNGLISWKDLAVGYYVLEETSPLPGYDEAATSIITMPMGKYVDGQPTTEWNYNVHVYPKNVKPNSGVKKEILGGDEQEFKVGEQQTWAIEALTTKKGDATKVLFEAGSPDKYGSMAIKDTLDARLDYKSHKVILMGGTEGPKTLTENTDYVLTGTTPNASDPDKGKTPLVWTLDNTILKYIVEKKVAAVRVEVTTEVNNKAIVGTNVEADTKITNKGIAAMKFVGESSPTDVLPTDPDPSFELARVEVEKIVWQSGWVGSPFKVDTWLNGAEFKIALSLADAKAGNYVKDANNDDLLVVTGGTKKELKAPATAIDPLDPSTYTEVDAGWGAFVGLSVDAGTNSKDADGNTMYYLVETKAPVGFIKSQTAWEATIHNKVEDSEKPGSGLTLVGYATIQNQHVDDENGPMPEGNPTFKLPKTGGIGTVAFMVGGAVLLLAALVFFRKSRKEEEENANIQE